MNRGTSSHTHAHRHARMYTHARGCRRRVLIRRRVSTIGKNRGSGGTCSRVEADEERLTAARSMSGRNKCAWDSLSLSAPSPFFSLSFSFWTRSRSASITPRDFRRRGRPARSLADRETSTSEIRSEMRREAMRSVAALWLAREPRARI